MGPSPAIDKDYTRSYLSTDFARRRAELLSFQGHGGPESAAFPFDSEATAYLPHRERAARARH
jgi:hypothetical protein